MSIDLLLAGSLLSVLLERYLPTYTPYIYQLAAIIGFGQLWVSKEFLAVFGIEMRFWYAFLYLLVALGSVIAMNAYLATIQRRLALAGLVFNTVTLPSILGTIYFFSQYANNSDPAVPSIPLVALETILGALIVYYVGMLFVRTLPSLKSRLSSWREDAEEKGGETEFGKE